MTTTIQTIDLNHTVSPDAATHNSASARAVESEWTKLRTLSSTWRTAVVAVIVSVVLGALLCSSQVSQWGSMTAQQRQGFDPTACSLGGFFLLGAVLLGALGVRSVTTEYSTGMIRSTFTATPTRRLVLVAKAAVTAAFVFPVAFVAAGISFELGQQIFTSKHLQVSLGHPGVVEALVFGALAVSLVTIIGVGLGGLIRHTAASTTALVLVVVGGVTLGQFLPAGLRQYVPGTALEAAVTVNHSAGLLRPGAAVAVLALYGAIAMLAASIRLARHDA